MSTNKFKKSATVSSGFSLPPLPHPHRCVEQCALLVASARVPALAWPRPELCGWKIHLKVSLDLPRGPSPTRVH